MLAPFNDTLLLQWVAPMQQSGCPLNVTQVFWHLQASGYSIKQGPMAGHHTQHCLIEMRPCRPSVASMACTAASQLGYLLAHRETLDFFDLCLLRMRHSFPVLRQDVHGAKAL